MPLAIAAGAVLVIAVVVILVMERGAGRATVAPVNAPADAYADNLPISNLQMSESSNLAGSKVTYLDGHIANKGNRTVTGISVQVLFRNSAQEVAQNETQPLKYHSHARSLCGYRAAFGGASEARRGARFPPDLRPRYSRLGRGLPATPDSAGNVQIRGARQAPGRNYHARGTGRNYPRR